MKTNTLLGLFTAICMIFLVSVVSATSVVTIDDVTFNDVSLLDGSDNDMSGFAGEVVPVRVLFTANVDSEDVRVRAEIYGGRDDSVDTTSRFNVVEGHRYTKLLSLRLPSNLKDITKDLTLEIKVYDANHSNTKEETTFEINMQRESYELDILAVDYNYAVSAGEIVPVAVVVKNTGFQRSDDAFVVVRVPELGISTRNYIGDMIPVEDNCDDCDEEDAVQKVLYIKIPAAAESGIYEIEVEAYDSESSSAVRQMIAVSGMESSDDENSQDLEAGKTNVAAVVWTIVLVVIFVTLLALLIYLLTRKDKQVEEVETSYY